MHECYMYNLGYREIKTVLSLVTLVLCMEGSYKLHVHFVGVANGIFAVTATIAPSQNRIIRKNTWCIIMLTSKMLACRTQIQ